jgi:maltooligosyltrehalose trehalohydrolase
MPNGMSFPDPASRAQAGDVHDPSLVVDPSSYAWQHGDWRGRPWHETVIYELHPGMLGGFVGMREHLPRLKALGVTAIESMPVAQFPGAHNWGYDGVLPYAPDSAYGTPDQLKSLIDDAHGMGLMVFLDVVYNHFGPDGAYIHAFANKFFRDDLNTPWGASIDFRRPEVRDYFEQNALYWLQEYRFDGLRFDALHAISEPDFLDEMAATIRTNVHREVHLVMEHEGNAVKHLRATPDAPGFDAQWTDDVHHVLHVLLTGEVEGYYEDYKNAITMLSRAMAEGFIYQGDWSEHACKFRGEKSAHLPTTSFVIFLQNHDQTGNRALGERLTVLADPRALRAAQGMLLLAPFIPLLFMGEEVQSKTPFLFFTDHGEELAELVRKGRREEFKHFPAFKDPGRRDAIPDPNARSTFEASAPDFTGDDSFVRGLLTLRRDRIVPGIPGARSLGSKVIGKAALTAQWRMGNGEVLTIAISFGDQAALPAPSGELLFESEPGVWDAAKAGTLRDRSAIVWIGSSQD